MSIFSHRAFDQHEQVMFCHDAAAGLRAIIAIHNTRRGPALGGCRMYPYVTEDDAIFDVLRLARGMSYKSALAGLDLGGGKSVIIGDPRRDKTPTLLQAMGRFIDSLGGRYIAAEDSGTQVADIKLMGTVTAHVAGIQDKPAADGTRSGDPSPATAYGVFMGIKAAVKHQLGRDELHGLRVAVQGVGNVGLRLARYLREAGAQLWVTDVYPAAVQQAVQELGAQAVAPEAIIGLDVDVFAPCALGAVINDASLPRLQAAIVAGAANNQLAEPRHGTELYRRGILYAPDYAINAGGIIDVAQERLGFDRAQLLKQIEGIYDTLLTIFTRAAQAGLPPGTVADQLAEERLHGI